MEKKTIEDFKNNIVYDDNLIVTKKEKENTSKWETVINDYKKLSKTNLLEKVNFENKLDFEILERLPLSEEQKELLLIDVLSNQYPEDKVIENYKQKILNK